MFSRPTLAKDTEEGKEDACNNCDRVRGPRLPSRRAETQLLKSVRTRAAAREEGEGKGDRKEEARAKRERGRRKRGQRGERENPISVHPSAWGTKPNGTTEKKKFSTTFLFLTKPSDWARGTASRACRPHTPRRHTAAHPLPLTLHGAASATSDTP